MTPHAYTIAFTYLLENGKFRVDLIADVEVIGPPTWYSVKNFRTSRSDERHVLPDVQLKKHKGRWVHQDSEKETELSKVVGAAIEAANGHLSGSSSEGQPPFSGTISETHP